MLRKSDGTRFSSWSDDEVGGYEARSARSERQRAEQSSTDGRHKSWPAAEVWVVAYGGESTMLDEHLLRRLTLHISMLNAKQACRT